MIKPMLAEDYVESKISFPVGLMPKIDGVRGLNLGGTFTGRSMRAFSNKFITKRFTELPTFGLDGELAAEEETHPLLCSLTSSALSTIEGEPYLYYHCFDYITPDTINLPYQERYEFLKKRLNWIYKHYINLKEQFRLVPMYIINSVEELREKHKLFISLGYEGSIIRDLQGKYKQGRSTVREGGYLRIKDFIEEDAIVIGIKEETINNNESKINRLGYLEKSSHIANKVPSGRLGSLLCIDVKTKKEIIVSCGSMEDKDKVFYFNNPHLILGARIKYKFFPKGIKDKPRFPVFQSIRTVSDTV